MVLCFSSSRLRCFASIPLAEGLCQVNWLPRDPEWQDPDHFAHDLCQNIHKATESTAGIDRAASD